MFDHSQRTIPQALTSIYRRDILGKDQTERGKYTKMNLAGAFPVEGSG